MREEFGERVVAIVKDVTKDESQKNWRERSEAYLHHLETQASDEAVIVSAADKTHNLLSVLTDYKTVGEDLWQRFSTKSSTDQLWWYISILAVAERRGAPIDLRAMLRASVEELKVIVDGISPTEDVQ